MYLPYSKAPTGTGSREKSACKNGHGRLGKFGLLLKAEETIAAQGCPPYHHPSGTR